jgi:hypothetical protein
MRVSSVELAIVALTIGYVAFFTHPVPAFLQSFLASPVGVVIVLGGVFAVAVYKSLIVGVFLAIAFVMSVNGVTEYMHNKTPDVKEEKPQPKSAGVPSPSMTGVLKAMQKGPAFKGDTKLPQVGQKKGMGALHSTPPTAKVSASAPKTIEKFASFY